MEKHIAVVGALQIGLSILGILIGVIVFVVLIGAGMISQDNDAMFILSIIAVSVLSLILILSVPGIIGGIGVLKRREWARILVLVLSAIDLLNIPIGTAVGIYSIWVLIQDETVAAFKSGVQDES
ncbi:MAG: hypothetical protein V2J62_00765 [candidate division KSB1 bacterium]|nr:hypothetical protein [candidate division KSB1 bacterium]